MWLVDPQDGTTAAEEGFRGSAISIALLCNGRPVLGVVLAYAAPDNDGDLFFWAEGMEHVRRNHAAVVRKWPANDESESVALISQHADRSSKVNAKLLHPMRYRTIPGVAYRLALAAVGEGELAVSLNGPAGWDVGGGHALLLGAGGDLFDATGETGYLRSERLADQSGHGEMLRRPQGFRPAYVGRPWDTVLRRDVPKTRASSSLSFLVHGKTVKDSRLLSRAQGCLLGQLAGDALGSLVEFSTAAKIAREYADGPSTLVNGGHWNTLAGQPTDDSELALALARSIVAKGSYDRDGQRWPTRAGSIPVHSMLGGTTRQALSAVLDGVKRGERPAEAAVKAVNGSSQANGALMRISPLAIFGYAKSAEELGALARADAKLTHPHPVCQDANAILAAATASR